MTETVFTESPLCATCGIAYDMHAESYGRLDGAISNCAARLGAPVSDCQMCAGTCPPPHSYAKRLAGDAAFAGYLDGYHGVPLYPLPAGTRAVSYRAGWADGLWDRSKNHAPGTSYTAVP